ncbi:hypothetical protein GCM10010282_37530 [Streptomyces roseolus]|nr:hypothetical protein GCM10010282_37530 [Streptomyces roseolus]
MNSGSVDSRGVWARCGAGANGRRIRETADRDMPAAAAIDLVDQWVAFSGVSPSVLTMTRSTSASVIFRGTPGPGSSHKPSRPRSMNRRRQVRSVSGVFRSRRDISMVEWPSASRFVHPSPTYSTRWSWTRARGEEAGVQGVVRVVAEHDVRDVVGAEAECGERVEDGAHVGHHARVEDHVPVVLRDVRDGGGDAGAGGAHVAGGEDGEAGTPAERRVGGGGGGGGGRGGGVRRVRGHGAILPGRYTGDEWHRCH